MFLSAEQVLNDPLYHAWRGLYYAYIGDYASALDEWNYIVQYWDGVRNKITTIVLPTNIIRLRYCFVGECREQLGRAIEPIYVPPPIAGYAILIPLAFFVALGIRGDLKTAAAGMAAYSFVAPILMNLLGIELSTSIALTALLFSLAILMMYIASR